MALFLESILEEKEEVLDYSIEDAYNGLLESVTDIHELNESLLFEDYKMLSESTEQKENFLKKAGTKIKEFIIKLRDNIVNFLGKLGSIVSNLWVKISNRKDAQISLPKGFLQRFKKNADDVNSFEQVIEKNNGTVAEYTNATTTKMGILKASLQQTANDFIYKKDNKGREIVNIAAISALLMSPMFKKVRDSAKTRLTKAASIVQNASLTNTAASKQLIQKYKKYASNYLGLANFHGKLYNMLMKSIRVFRPVAP